MFDLILYKLFYNPYIFVRKNTKFISVGNSILSKNFQVTLRNSKKECLIIGNLCILECCIIFENGNATISIGDGTYIGARTKLISATNIVIGNNVQISWDVCLYDHNGYSLNFKKRKDEFSKIFKNYSSGDMLSEFDWDIVKSSPIIIEDDVWIGFGATILKGVRIGKGAIVGAHSVVREDVEPFTVVMGNPAVKTKVLEYEI